MSRTILHRRLLLLLLPLLLPFAGCDGGPVVDVASPRVGEIRESFEEPGRSRLARDYRITLPVAGRVGRIELEPGDRVEKGQTLVRYDLVPFQEAVREARAVVGEFEASIAVLEDDRLEETALVETQAVVQATEEALNAADKQIEAAEARAQREQRELARMQKLFEEGAIPESQLEDVKLRAETAVIELREQEFTRAGLNAMLVAVRTGPIFVRQWLEREDLQRLELEQKLEQARSRLALAEHDLALARSVVAPIDGVVLERFEQGDRALQAGDAVLLLGNLADLEVVADVLTQDALRLAPGSQVELELAARQDPVVGHVKLIEPQGFTKLSSLGVEQQRVNVIVALDERPEDLGVGFRVRARFITGRKEEALTVPRFSVLQAPDGGYYVFRVVGDTLERTSVTLGLRSDLRMEIASGLSPDDRLVATPDTTLRDGQDVQPAGD